MALPLDKITCLRNLALVASLLFSLLPNARADSAQAQFCIVPVKDGAPTAADQGETWRIHSATFRIPGLPALVFTPVNRGGQWTIDADRRLVPYSGPFPKSYLDRGDWVAEPWSSRVVAITYGGGVSVLRPGTNHFETIETPNLEPKSRFTSVVTLPRRKLTIVVSGGVPFIVDESSLRPWLSPEELAAHGLRGISGLYDAPSLSATIVVDLDRHVHVLADDGSWHEVASIRDDDYGYTFDAAESGAVVFIAAHSVLAIRQNSASSSARYSVETLAETSASRAGFRFPTSRLFKRVITYDGAGIFNSHPRWRHLGPEGMEDISGGDIGISELSEFPWIGDLPTLGRTLIGGRDGLFLYDGAKIVPVPQSGVARIGRFPGIHDLSSIRRVIVASEMGLFELTSDGRLVAKTMPFPVDGYPRPELSDWPEAGVALVSTRSGIYALDTDLRATPVPGGDQIELGFLDFAVGTNPGTGEMVLSGSRGLFLAVRAQGRGVCDQTDEE